MKTLPPQADTGNVLTTATHPNSIRIFNAYTKGAQHARRGHQLTSLPEQRNLIDQAAQLLGKNRSDFMLEASCDKAQSILLDQVFFTLDDAEFEQFTALLDTPTLPNPGLERLLSIKSPWATGT